MTEKEIKDFRINFGKDLQIIKDLDMLKKIYNLNRYTDLVKHIVQLEKLKHNIK